MAGYSADYRKGLVNRDYYSVEGPPLPQADSITLLPMSVLTVLF